MHMILLWADDASDWARWRSFICVHLSSTQPETVVSNKFHTVCFQMRRLACFRLLCSLMLPCIKAATNQPMLHPGFKKVCSSQMALYLDAILPVAPQLPAPGTFAVRACLAKSGEDHAMYDRMSKLLPPCPWAYVAMFRPSGPCSLTVK